MMDRCPKCHEYVYESSVLTHRCKPVFMVWKYDDKEEYADKIHESDEQSAAEKWAENDDCNSAEYAIVSGDTVKVFVKSSDGTTKKFEVSGEAVPSYYATEIE